MDNRNIIKKQGNTFRACSNAYIDAKQNVLSPTTINGYNGIIRQLSDQLMNKDIGEITQLDVQKEINNYAKNHSPKSTKNLHSFISSVLSLYRNDIHLRTHLPMNIKKTPYIPTREDIKTIMEECYNTKYEIPLKLACLGLRRSEICALTKSDIKGNKVYISCQENAWCNAEIFLKWLKIIFFNNRVISNSINKIVIMDRATSH